MDFTGYSQLLSYIERQSPNMILDIMGLPLLSSAGYIVTDLEDMPVDIQFDVILCRYILRTQPDPFATLSALINRLNPGGYLILQDYLLPDDEQVVDFINGFIHLFDKKHIKSFAQYAWDGLLLDVGLNIQLHHQQSINSTIKEWITTYQTSEVEIQRAQVMLVQAPDAVTGVMQLRYPGTAYAEFELQELVCISQKEA